MRESLHNIGNHVTIHPNRKQPLLDDGTAMTNPEDRLASLRPARTTAHYARGTRVARAEAFTLLELLVVIGIIAILIGLVVAVGSSVGASSKAALSKDTMRVLDTVLSSYESSAQGIPPPYVNQPGNTTKTQVIVDARASETDGVDSLGWFLYQCSNQSGVDKAIQTLPAKFLQPGVPGASDALPTVKPPIFNTVKDPWGKSFRYVHPALDGVIDGDKTEDLIGAAPKQPTARTYTLTNIKRLGAGGTDPANSDGGTSPDARPYFYSSGPDGDPSTTGDNVYIVTPSFPAAK
jgi:type II secretory pathway pseudopilin PulG